MSIDYNVYFGPVVEVDEESQHYANRQLTSSLNERFTYREIGKNAYFILNKKDSFHHYLDAKYENHDIDIREKFYEETLENFFDLYRLDLDVIRLYCPEATVRVKLLVWQS